MRPADRDPIDRFDAALEALSRGRATPFEEMDPDLVAAARRLRTMDAAQHAPPGLANQIWAELMNQRGLGEAPPLDPVGQARPSLNGKTAPRPWRATRLERPRPTRLRWTLTHLAVAALFLILLAGAAIAVRYVTTERPTAYLEAVGKAQVDTLVDATVEGAADTTTPLSIERWTFAAGPAALTLPPLDGPQWLVAERGTLVAMVAGERHDLASGASLVIPAGQGLAIENAGLQEASLLRGLATAQFELADYDRDAIGRSLALETKAHPSLPEGPSRVLFERLTLEPGAILRIEPATGQDWVDVVSGDLGMTLVGDVLPAGWTSGREREAGDDELLPALPVNTKISLHNIGEEPLVLLRLRVTPEAESQS